MGWDGVGWGGGGGGGRASFERGGGEGRWGFRGGREGGGVRPEQPPPLSFGTKMYHSRFFSFWCWGFVVKTDHSFLEGCFNSWNHSKLPGALHNPCPSPAYAIVAR